MGKAVYHLQNYKIPSGYQIYRDRLEVAGVGFRKHDAATFAKKRKIWLEIEPEPQNKFDPNAIKIIGVSKGFFSTKKYFIGYIPKQEAKIITKTGLINKIQPRLLKTYVSENGYVEIYFQILGPSSEKTLFDSAISLTPLQYVKHLKASHKYDEAEAFLLDCIEAEELNSRNKGVGVAPWCYEQLAIIRRKKKDYTGELEILERFEGQMHAPGRSPEKLKERLQKVRNQNK